MMSNLHTRFSLRGIIGGLMLADHLGDVADEINHLCDLAGIPRPEGGFGEWTERDYHNVGLESDAQQLSSKDVWPDNDADGMREEVRRQWPQLADALDAESGLS